MLPSFQKELNPEASAQYIRYGYVPDPLCILKNTYKLEAGSIIKYDKINYIKKIKYWDSFNEYIKASNKKFKGKVAYTIVNGSIVYDGFEIVENKAGKFINSNMP